MRCHSCGTPSEVRDSRPREDGKSWRRRRYCPACNVRFTTVEAVVPASGSLVITENGPVVYVGGAGPVIIWPSGVWTTFDAEKIGEALALGLRAISKINPPTGDHDT